MIYSLKILNSEASVNDFYDIGAANIYKGSDAKVIMQIYQPDKKGIRYISLSGAVLTVDLQKSDGTVLTKTLTNPFAADDRSILQLVLTNVETADLISQNLIVKITEGPLISYAVLQGGFKMSSLTGVGC